MPPKQSPQSTPKTPYQILGVQPDASPETIKKAYRKKARQCHPDVAQGHDEEFKALSGAYRLLSCPDDRARYDATGQTDRPDSEDAIHEKAVGVMGEIVMSIVMNPGFNPGDDLAGKVADKVAKIKAGIADDIKSNGSLGKLIEDTMERLTDGTDGKVITLSLHNRYMAVMARDSELHRSLKVLENVESMLADIDYRADEAEKINDFFQVMDRRIIGRPYNWSFSEV